MRAKHEARNMKVRKERERPCFNRALRQGKKLQPPRLSNKWGLVQMSLRVRSLRVREQNNNNKSLLGCRLYSPMIRGSSI